MAERTFVIIKPDSITRGMAGRIISLFEEKGLKIVAMKMVKIKKRQFEQLYSHLIGRSFMEEYRKFMRRTPVILLVLEGLNAVEVVRKLCGITNSREAEPSTIRGRYGMSGRMNLIHAADSLENAKKEMDIFFKKKEIYDYKSPLTQVIYSSEEQAELGAEKKERIVGRPRKLPGKEDEPRD
ncbi:MAG: nucleoside-diphosphate kinase [Candidatus Micrarchaeia archaeon]